jgi:hypothetical protein
MNVQVACQWLVTCNWRKIVVAQPRPSMVAFVCRQGLLGDADNLTLGNTKATSAAKLAIMQIAEALR